MNDVIGSCSICGGQVLCPRVWHGVIPPVPTCSQCGATASVGPVIPMVPRQPQKQSHTTTARTEAP